MAPASTRSPSSGTRGAKTHLSRSVGRPGQQHHDGVDRRAGGVGSNDTLAATGRGSVQLIPADDKAIQSIGLPCSDGQGVGDSPTPFGQATARRSGWSRFGPCPASGRDEVQNCASKGGQVDHYFGRRPLDAEVRSVRGTGCSRCTSSEGVVKRHPLRPGHSQAQDIGLLSAGCCRYLGSMGDRLYFQPMWSRFVMAWGVASTPHRWHGVQPQHLTRWPELNSGPHPGGRRVNEMPRCRQFPPAPQNGGAGKPNGSAQQLKA